MSAPTYTVAGQTYHSVGTAIGGLADQMTTLSGRVDALSATVTQMQSQRNADVRDLRAGIASSMAMGSAPMPSTPGRTAWVVNAANFRGMDGVGGSIAHRLNLNVPFALTAGFSYSYDNTAVRVGLAGEF